MGDFLSSHPTKILLALRVPQNPVQEGKKEKGVSKAKEVTHHEFVQDEAKFPVDLLWSFLAEMSQSTS